MDLVVTVRVVTVRAVMVLAGCKGLGLTACLVVRVPGWEALEPADQVVRAWEAEGCCLMEHQRILMGILPTWSQVSPPLSMG